MRQALGAHPRAAQATPPGRPQIPHLVATPKKISEEGHCRILFTSEPHRAARVTYPSRAHLSLRWSTLCLSRSTSSSPRRTGCFPSAPRAHPIGRRRRVKRVTEGATAKRTTPRKRRSSSPSPSPSPRRRAPSARVETPPGEGEARGKRTRGNDGKKGKRAAEEGGDEDEDPKGKKDKESIMPSSAEKDKDVDMGDADDIDLGDVGQIR